MASISKKEFLKLFFSQLFDIGYSTGSLFSEILGVFRTFQRFSASQSFSTRFSDQCLKMFEWAKNIYNQILSSIPMDPLTDFELFYTYTFAFPLMMLIFISTMSSGITIFYYAILFGLFLAFGVGIGYFGEDLVKAIAITVVFGILIILGFIFRKKKDFLACFLIFEYFILFKNNKKEIKINCCIFGCHMIHVVRFTFSVVTSFCMFSLLIIPILEYRTQLMYFIMIVFSIIFVLCGIIEGIVQCCWKTNRKKNFDKVTVKSISFLTNCFTLLIIPSTDYYVKLMQDSYKHFWNCTVSYIGVGLILPITLIYLMILNEVPDITDKYNNAKYGFFNYYYIEIIDVTKQVVYALLSAYDVYYGCILLEFVWVMLILVLLPYKKRSEYCLTLGNSLIMFISNGAMIYSSLKNNVMFSNAVSIGFVVIACIPAVASLYVYFIYDFETDIEINNESEELDEFHESENQLEQSEKLSENIDQPNSLEQIEKENDQSNSLEQIENKSNQLELIEKDGQSNSLEQIENENKNENQQNLPEWYIRYNNALNNLFSVDANAKIGNNNTIDNIANSIKAITPIAFFFYGISISMFAKKTKL